MEKRNTRIRKPKLMEVDLLRFIAILAVVMIHSTSTAAGSALAEGSTSQILFYILNRGLQFAVPLFIMVSGAVLFYRYEGEWSWRTGLDFYRKRIWSVAVPYLVWSFLYYIYYQLMFEPKVEFRFDEFLDLLPWADAMYHLYFMIIILQFYLLFPLLMGAINRWPVLKRWMVPVAIAAQAGFYIYKFYFASLKHGPSLFMTYIGYFLIGGYAGLAYLKIRNWKPVTNVLWGILLLASGGFYTWMFLANRYKHIRLHNNWYELDMFLYVVSLFFVLMALGRLVYSRWGRFGKAASFIGRYAFGIYLVHPMIMIWFDLHWKPAGGILKYDLFTFGAFAIYFAASLILSWAYGKLAGLLRRKA